MINKKKIKQEIKNFKNNKPFDHFIVDNFLSPDTLKNIVKDFPNYNSPHWHVYKNVLEDKKTINSWFLMPPNTYNLFHYLNSDDFVSFLSNEIGTNLISDNGLHGGGWHSHTSGGNLNPHLDYSIHPKIGLERFLNLIIYVNPRIKDKHGGHLGFWEHNSELNSPGNLAKEIYPKFNRAVFFRTNQNSWHGLSRPLNMPKGVYRNSLAIYYLKKASKQAVKREKALFAPRENQEDNNEIKKIIRLRSQTKTAESVYRKSK